MSPNSEFAFEDRSMANKLEKKKRVVKNLGTTKSEANPAMTGRTEPEPDCSAGVPSSKTDVINAETAKVLRDADAGKNLLNYASLEEMFKDLEM
jgi:hypothetical protein